MRTWDKIMDVLDAVPLWVWIAAGAVSGMLLARLT